MKYKLIVLSLTTAIILTATGCLIRTNGKAEDKITEKVDIENIENLNQQPNKENTTSKNNGGTKETTKVSEGDTEEYIKSIIKDRAIEALTTLKNNDMKEFSKLVHPTKGVRFSPYAYVEESKDLKFTADKIKTIASDNTEYIWGNYDGSGEPIKLTFSQYLNKFVYDKDFINAKEIGYNKTIGKGNTINNALQVYNNAIIVEYHFPGFNPGYDGIDWESLRLVFEKDNDTWYIIGIIHDQWTI